MTSSPATRTGGQLIVDCLAAQGVEHVFCVPGESYLAVLDALHDASIAVTVCRQEGGATMMAEAQGRLTGRPGIAMVTRGPGATNASAGVHIAEHDSTPLILFVGQIERAVRGRGAWQELDYKAVFGSMTKWAVEIDDVGRIPEIISRAFHVAMQGRPGPVVIALPEDMLLEATSAAAGPRVEAVETWPGLTQMADLQKRLWAAERPVLVLGGSGWTEQACARVRRFAERFDLPVATSFRRAMLFPADHPNYAGEIGLGPNPKLKARIEAADLVIVAGGRMAEVPSQGYTLFDVPAPRQTLVHIHADAMELGRVYHPALGINATPAAFAAALETVQPPNDIRWRDATRQAREDYLGWSEQPARIPGPSSTARSWPGCATGCRRTPSSPTGRATTPFGWAASCASAASARSSRPCRAPWATACRLPWGQSACILSAWSYALPATGASSCTGRSSRQPCSTTSRSSWSWSTTACTAPSACIRSASILAASAPRA